jgi:hypothetical protein
MFTLQINGIQDLQNNLEAITENLSEQVKEAIANTANAIADNAKKNASGKIADSITTTIADDGMSATVSTDSPDAVSTEYGAKPFFNPAYEEQADKLKTVLNN